MMHRVLVAAAIAFTTSNVARAGLVFDTITGTSPLGTSGAAADGSAIMAASFTDIATPSFTAISLMLAADNPGDGGSVQVFLVPDDGSGSATGVAGNPDSSNAVPVASIKDSSLAKLSTSGTRLVTLANIANSLGKTTVHNEYWIELLSQGSSVEWAYNADGKGFGTANQASFTDVSATYPDNGSGVAGAFALRVVDAPEPATIGLLGAALASLGYFRRRKLAKT